MATVSGRPDEVKRWREDLWHASRANMVSTECSWALWDVARELRTIPQERWAEVRPRMEGVHVRGSAGEARGCDPTFGDLLGERDLLRERIPPPWPGGEMRRGRVDELLEQVDAVEAARGAAAPWAGFQEYLYWLEWMTRPWQVPGRGRPEWTAFWCAALEVVNYVCMGHVDFDGKPDGWVSWRRVMVILKALGWPVRYRTTRAFKVAFQRWERTLSPAPVVVPPGFEMKRLGRLTLLVRARSAPALESPEKPGR
jgi:hypothetical protein